MATTKIKGELEIDHERGVIYFHNEEGYTTLRLCNLPKPIPRRGRAKKGQRKELYQLDYIFPPHLKDGGKPKRKEE